MQMWSVYVYRCVDLMGRYMERGMAGSDPSTRGRSPVVLEVLFHSRTLSKRGIQSEIMDFV